MQKRAKLLIIRLICFISALIFSIMQLEYTLPIAYALIGMGWGTFFQLEDDKK